MNSKVYIYIAVIASVLAGVLHGFFVSVQHIEIAPEFWFFILIGLAQIAWGGSFYFKQSPSFYFIVAILNGSVTVFWLSTRIFPAPFATLPESFYSLGILIGILQVITFITSYFATRKYYNITLKLLILAILLSLILGFIGYYVAKSSEALALLLSTSTIKGPL